MLSKCRGSLEESHPSILDFKLGRRANLQASVLLTHGPKGFSQDWPGKFLLHCLQGGLVAPQNGAPQRAKRPQATDVPRG